MVPALADGKHLATCTEHAAWHEAVPRNSFLTMSLGFLGMSQAPSPSGLPAHTALIALLPSCSQSACSETDSPLVHPFLGRSAKLKSELLRKFQDHTCNDK